MSRYFFFTPKMASFAALATRNFTTVFAAILMVAPVLGLCPLRAARFCFTSFPMPGSTNSPVFLASL